MEPTPTSDNGRQSRGLARFWPVHGMPAPTQRQSDEDFGGRGSGRQMPARDGAAPDPQPDARRARPDTPASVPHWPEDRRSTTFGFLLIRMVAETAHHAGHADICRELIDGQGPPDADDYGDAEHWAAYTARLQAAADAFRTP